VTRRPGRIDYTVSEVAFLAIKDQRDAVTVYIVCGRVQCWTWRSSRQRVLPERGAK